MEPPKSGVLTVRKAILTTDKVVGCGPMKTPAQVVFYQARAGYEGPDKVKYEVTSENGEVAEIPLTLRLDTRMEIDYVRHGGIMPYVLNELTKVVPARVA